MSLQSVCAFCNGHCPHRKHDELPLVPPLAPHLNPSAVSDPHSTESERPNARCGRNIQRGRWMAASDHLSLMRAASTSATLHWTLGRLAVNKRRTVRPRRRSCKRAFPEASAGQSKRSAVTSQEYSRHQKGQPRPVRVLSSGPCAFLPEADDACTVDKEWT